MSLTASDVVSLTRSLSIWETSEYIFAGLVTLGCFGEYVSEFTDWFTGGIEAKKTRLAKRSTLLLVASLSFELVCLVRTNQLSERIIGSLDERAREASERSQIALTKSEAAITHSGAAEVSSARAGDKSDKAEKSASTAMTLAKGARQEADSFEKDIKDAKRNASEAKALLAEVRRLAKEAQERAASAEKGTERLTTKFADRILSDAQVRSIADKVKEFAEQEFDITPYWELDESLNIAKRISEALQLGGWKYVAPERSG